MLLSSLYTLHNVCNVKSVSSITWVESSFPQTMVLRKENSALYRRSEFANILYNIQRLDRWLLKEDLMKSGQENMAVVENSP